MFQKKMLNSAEVIHATDISEAQQIRAIGITSPIAIISNGVEQLSSREVSDFRRVRESRHEAVGRQYLFLSRVHRKRA